MGIEGRDRKQREKEEAENGQGRWTLMDRLDRRRMDWTEEGRTGQKMDKRKTDWTDDGQKKGQTKDRLDRR